MKRIVGLAIALLFLAGLAVPVGAEAPDLDGFDIDGQLDALGKDELMEAAPEDARELLEETGLYDLSVEKLLQLSPRDFFSTLLEIAVQQIKKPLRTLGIVIAVLLLCAMLGGLRTAVAENAMTGMFTTVAVLCVLTSVIVPILDCIVHTSKAIKDTATFMLAFIPVFSAALTAAGQPVTGAAYNTFLFAACQVIAQVVAGALVPLMGIYLALCVVGSIVPEINIASAAKGIKSIVSWGLGFTVTLFVGLLSLQTLVSGSADGVATRTAKFLIGSFVPVVGGALSEAFNAAHGCLRLIRTSVGVYGVLVAAFTFLPVLLQTVTWYLVTCGASVAGDILGVGKVSAVLRSCSTVLGILLAVILSFALLIIVSTTVVMITGMGG